jgi:hypothetical protein
VLDSLKKLSLHFLQQLCLAFLMFLVAIPAWAQEKSPKSPAPPPPPSMRMPQPAPAPESMPREYKAPPARARQLPDEALEKKKVTDKVGGQEIRAKQGEEDK